jgi:predicted permease
MHDLRYALRVLKNNSGFTTAAVLTLGLGIGLNATVFSLFDALALRPVQLPSGQPAVSVYQDIQGVARSVHGGRTLFSWAEYQTYRRETQVFNGLAAYMPEVAVMLGADITPVRGQLTSCNYFSVLGATIAAGRGFTPEECAGDDAGPVLILSDDFWRAKFNADPHILGKTIKLDRLPFTVIGVAAPGFHGTEIVRPSFWAPVSMQWALDSRQGTQSYMRQTDMSWLALVGRLKPGVSMRQARANMSVIAEQIDKTEPGRTTTLSIGTVSLLGEPEEHRMALAAGSVLLVAVGLVLLIACSNVANLFLARATARQREIAVRLAMGASRARLVRQLLTESAVIAIAGGVLGTIVALWSATGVARFIGRDPTDTPIALSVGPDLRIFAYALLLVGLTALGFGLVPALQSTRPDLNRALKTGDAETSGGRGRLRQWLVGLQVATCMVLLIVAGLFLRGLNRAETVEPGWQMDGALAVSFDFYREGYTADRAAAFTRDLDARLRALPGVSIVANASVAPLGQRRDLSGFATPAMAKRVTTELALVGPDYLASVGLPVLKGRSFTSADAASELPLTIVNEAAARRFWPGEDPVGRTIKGYKDTYQVIGVTRDAELSDLSKRHDPYFFILERRADAMNITSVIVRSRAPLSASLLLSVRAAAMGVDPDIHVRVAPLRDNVRPYIQASQLLMGLSVGLGVLGLLLASLGIYGTVAFTVARRTREIGIRVALGAYGAQVTRMIVRQAMRPVVIGAAVGTTLCAAVSGLLAPVLFGVGGHDAIAFVGVPALLLIVAVGASYAPARRAVRVNPVEALRAD